MNLMVMNILDLPDAGEFSMKGKGVVIKEENNIYLECESFMKGYVDYDFEEKKVLGWKEVNEKQEQYSGRSLVFPK